MQSKNTLFDIKSQIFNVASKRRVYKLRKSVRKVVCNKHSMSYLFSIVLRRTDV